ncbi:MAG: YicC family protein [Proteobacteria bacterium]|nr:MAG: YicC family protein [Pseudomonadota bacterium]
MGVMSMTGFGTSTATASGRTYRIDVKSVNHKNLSVRLHLPTELAVAEVSARQLLRDRLQRGAVDVSVKLQSAGTAEPEVVVDRASAVALMKALQDLATHCGTHSPTLDVVLRYGDVIEVRKPELSADDASAVLIGGLGRALDQVLEMRRAEGQALAEDLLARVATLGEVADAVEAAAPEVLAAQENRLRQRLDGARAKLGVELDEARVATELAVFADRYDITEEIVRARTHLARFRDTLTCGGGDERGKRLDFLSQELLREFNTIGSKCRDAGIAGKVVDAKVELEKIREQAQNIA